MRATVTPGERCAYLLMWDHMHLTDFMYKEVTRWGQAIILSEATAHDDLTLWVLSFVEETYLEVVFSSILKWHWHSFASTKVYSSCIEHVMEAIDLATEDTW